MTLTNTSTGILRTVKTCSVSQMPELEGLLAGSLGHAGEEHAGVHGEVVVVALVDDAARHAAVHPQREVLADAEELHGVVQYSTMQYSTVQYSTVPARCGTGRR